MIVLGEFGFGMQFPPRKEKDNEENPAKEPAEDLQEDVWEVLEREQYKHSLLRFLDQPLLSVRGCAIALILVVSWALLWFLIIHLEDIWDSFGP